MQPEEMRLVVQTVESRNPASPMLVPATVASVNLDAAVATLVVDGDPPDSTVDAQILVGGVSQGGRVMVMFDKPSGVYVAGVINQKSETGALLYRASIPRDWSSLPAPSSLFLDDDSIFLPKQKIELKAGRLYLLNVIVTAAWASGGAGPNNSVYVDGSLFYSLEDDTGTGIGPQFDVIDAEQYARSGSASRVLAPSVDYTAEFEFQLVVMDGEARIFEASGTVVDAGPSSNAVLSYPSA